MANCGYCSSTIIFGGVRTQETRTRFCNQKCYNSAVLLAVSDQIPIEVVNQQVRMVHQGLCPKCKGSGSDRCTHKISSLVRINRYLLEQSS